MENEKTDKEIFFQRKANIFLKNKWIAHIRDNDHSFYNGILFEANEDYLVIHDRVIGRKKILYVDIIKFVEYVPEGSK